MMTKNILQKYASPKHYFMTSNSRTC